MPNEKELLEEIKLLKEQIKKQQEEIEKLKKKARRQRWWNVWLVWKK